MTTLRTMIEGCQHALSESAKQFRAMEAPGHAGLCEMHLQGAADSLGLADELVAAGNRVIKAFEKLGTTYGFGAAERLECERAMVALKETLQRSGGAA